MLTYIILITVVLIYSLIQHHLDVTRTHALLLKTSRSYISYYLDFLIIIILIIFSGLRYNVGTDYAQLYQLYSSFVGQDFFEIFFNCLADYEFGKWFIIASCLKITNNPRFIFFIMSILFILPIYSCLRRKIKYYYYGIFIVIAIGFYTTSFNIMWQMIAVSLLFFSNIYLESNKKSKFFLLVLIAGTIHISALIAGTIILLIRKLKFNEKNFLYIALIFVFILFGQKSIPIILSKIGNYSMYSSYRGSGLGLYLQIIVWGCMFLLLFYNKKKYIKNNPTNYYYLLYVAIAIGFMIVGTQNVMFDRIAVYFKLYILLLLPNFMEANNNKVKPLVIYVIMCCLVIWYLFYLNYNGVIPYRIY